MADELQTKARLGHDGWKVSVRNARLIEDGQGSIISKLLTRSEPPSLTSKLCNTEKKIKFPPITKNGHRLCHKIFHRNNPHPRMSFPFQTGDRLNSYMIWSADMEPPPFVREKFPPRPKLKQSTNALNEGYKTVYQLEVSELPARIRYGVDSPKYQPPELLRNSPHATKYTWADNGFNRDNFPAFSHHDVPAVPSYHDVQMK